MARGYAATLKTNEDHRQPFQVVAGLDDAHRRALIKGYREEGQSRGVVQAISDVAAVMRLGMGCLLRRWAPCCSGATPGRR